MINWNGQSTDGLKIEWTILLRLPKRLTIILTLRITLKKAKPTWNGINTLLSRKKNFAQPTKLIIGEAGITDPHELSNAFNRHFTDIGPNLASQINLPRVSFRDFFKSCDSTFELELLTTDELRKLVNDIPRTRLMASMVFQLPS